MDDFEKDATVLMHEVRFASDHVSAARRDILANDIAALANGDGGTCWLGLVIHASEPQTQ